ncbi:Aste57867_9776 [Aphanomyces stellatus]|uniref:Aste57867_9776 protein n=1 Tax=Aphanomyces stellatus TaxID=120398 RepID=A0A485KP17_9STRA|nr:hypothetical protein As57867_009737 [Aphanomyces stellatus]VFT86655.1 Aste57867_9776 [Aphanomyces stellatus]
MQVVGRIALVGFFAFTVGMAQTMDTTAPPSDICSTAVTGSCILQLPSGGLSGTLCFRDLNNCGECVSGVQGNRQAYCYAPATDGTCNAGDSYCPSALPPMPVPGTPKPTPAKTPRPTNATTSTPSPSTTTTTFAPKPTTAPPSSSDNTSLYIGVGCGVVILVAVFAFGTWKRRQTRQEKRELDSMRLGNHPHLIGGGGGGDGIDDDGELHGDPALFNTIGHQSMILSPRSEPDAMWWAQATQAERDTHSVLGSSPSHSSVGGNTPQHKTPHSTKAKPAVDEVAV